MFHSRRSGVLATRTTLFYPLLVASLAGVQVVALAAWPDGDANAWERLRAGPGVMNHPVYVVPSRAVAIPAAWPLDHEGRMTCLTCHRALPVAGAANLRSALASSSDARPFCVNCHGVSATVSAATMHWQAIGRAHIGPDVSTGGRGRGILDASSRRCLGCHDGLTASEPGYQTPGQAAGDVGDRARNHPIGVAYPAAGKRRAEVPLRPAALLPRTISLPSGVVGCVSCHNLYNLESNHLTVPIEGSRLCLACHEMD
jgi:hypothetical protein